MKHQQSPGSGNHLRFSLFRKIWFVVDLRKLLWRVNRSARLGLSPEDPFQLRAWLFEFRLLN